MPIEQIVTASLPEWPPNKTATRDLNADFSRMVFLVDITDFGELGHLNLNYLLMSALTPIGLNVFNWDAVEMRADWEESHGRFVEFNDVKDLLSDLHL